MTDWNRTQPAVVAGANAPDPALVEFARGVVASVVGAEAIAHIDTLQADAGKAVLLLAGPTHTGQRVIMKVAQRGFRPDVDFERTAAAMSLGFWRAYRSETPPEQAAAQRTLIYQLLWCLEYNRETPRHLVDTQHLCRALGVQFQP